MARQQSVKALCLAHKVTDLLPDAVGSLVRHAKLALQFFTAHTMTDRAKEIHRIEPRNERDAGLL